MENGFAAVLCSLLSEDHEFVAADPRNNVLVPERALEDFGAADEKGVALKVPERVIDALELVNVYKKKKKGIASAAGQLALVATFLPSLLSPGRVPRKFRIHPSNDEHPEVRGQNCQRSRIHRGVPGECPLCLGL